MIKHYDEPSDTLLLHHLSGLCLLQTNTNAFQRQLPSCSMFGVLNDTVDLRFHSVSRVSNETNLQIIIHLIFQITPRHIHDHWCLRIHILIVHINAMVSLSNSIPLYREPASSPWYWRVSVKIVKICSLNQIFHRHNCHTWHMMSPSEVIMKLEKELSNLAVTN